MPQSLKQNKSINQYQLLKQGDMYVETVKDGDVYRQITVD
jgi:hypothetical protein